MAKKLPQKKLLIIDDEENMLLMLEAMLSQANYQISTTTDGLDVIHLLNTESFDFILCDIKMPNINGLDLLKTIKKIQPDCTVIMMSAYGSIDTAIKSMKYGAYDFVSKPFKQDEVLLTFKKAEERELLKNENRLLKAEISKVRGNQSFSQIIHQSKEMERCIQLAQKAAEFNTTVLITGDSGTGKELLAKGIHNASSRRNRKFFAINCGSLPESLIESELFGHVKGAFTGADSNKKGIFEAAEKSSLFLDEIGELPLAMQVKLLRVLQEQEIKPIGSNNPRKIDVRIISATAKNLEEDVQSGRFREDLFYRLNVFRIKSPALQDRLSDIPVLVQHFIEKCNASLNKNLSSVSPEVMEILLSHNWPGNIRELENILQRAAVLTDQTTISKKQLPNYLVEKKSENLKPANITLPDDLISLKEAQKYIERILIDKAIKKNKGNKSKAAIQLEISYPSLLHKIKEYNLQKQ